MRLSPGVKCEMRFLVALLICTLLPAARADGENAKLLQSLGTVFSATSPRIDAVQIVDIKPRHTEYWVVARGYPSDLANESRLEDELFGVFVVDKHLVRIKKTVKVFPTRRWLDYRVWIEKYDMTKVEIRGEGQMYKDQAMSEIFEVPW